METNGLTIREKQCTEITLEMFQEALPQEMEYSKALKHVTRQLHDLVRNPIVVFGLHAFFDMINSDSNPSVEDRLHFEWLRFITFERYQGEGNAIALARNGFYHDENLSPSGTMCIYCKIAKANWKMSDNVEEQHRSLSPDCPLLRNNSDIVSQNVSIEEGDCPPPALPLATNCVQRPCLPEPARQTTDRSDRAIASSNLTRHLSLSGPEDRQNFSSYAMSRSNARTRTQRTRLTLISEHAPAGSQSLIDINERPTTSQNVLCFQDSLSRPDRQNILHENRRLASPLGTNNTCTTHLRHHMASQQAHEDDQNVLPVDRPTSADARSRTFPRLCSQRNKSRDASIFFNAVRASYLFDCHKQLFTGKNI